MDIEEGNKGMLVLVALQILPSWVTLARRTTAPYILSASSPAMMTKNTNVMTMSRLGFTANWQLFCELSEDNLDDGSDDEVDGAYGSHGGHGGQFPVRKCLMVGWPRWEL